MWRNKGEREKKERERKRKEKKRKGIGQRKENGDRAVTTLSYIPVYNLPLSLASQLGAASQLSAASELSPAAKLSKLWKYGGTCSPSPCSPAMKLSKYFLEVQYGCRPSPYSPGLGQRTNLPPVLCCAVLCRAVLCSAVLRCAVLCRAVPCRAALQPRYHLPARLITHLPQAEEARKHLRRAGC